MSVRKLSSIFDNASSTDNNNNNNNNNNKVVPPKKRPSLNTTTEQKTISKFDFEKNKPINVATNKPVTPTNHFVVNKAQNKRPPISKPKVQEKQKSDYNKDDVKTNKNVSKFKNMFESQIKDGINNDSNMAKTQRKYSIQNKLSSNTISSSVSPKTSTIHSDVSASSVSKETSISSNIKPLLPQKTISSKQSDTSSSLVSKDASMSIVKDNFKIMSAEEVKSDTSSSLVSKEISLSSKISTKSLGIAKATQKTVSSKSTKSDTSSKISSISSGIAKDSNFKALLSHKLQNPYAPKEEIPQLTVSSSNSNNIQYSSKEETAFSMPATVYQQNIEDLPQEGYLRMDAFRNKTNDVKATPTLQNKNMVPKIPPKIPKSFTRLNSEEGSSGTYLNTEDVKELTNYGLQLNMEQQWEQLDEYKYDYAEDFSISSRSNTLNSNARQPSFSPNLSRNETNAAPQLSHRHPIVPSVDSSGNSKPISTRNPLPTHKNKSYLLSFRESDDNTPKTGFSSADSPKINASPLLPQRSPIVPTIESSSNNTSPMPTHKNQSFLLSPKHQGNGPSFSPVLSRNGTIVPTVNANSRSVSTNSPRTPLLSNKTTQKSPTDDAPPLPPRSASISKSSTNSTSTPLPTAKLTSPDYPVFSPALNTPSSTQSIIKNEINPFTFDTVNAQKYFTDELRKELFKNEQVETSNSIDVEEKISDIIYGRKGLKFRESKDDHFFRDAVRLSFLSLQSDETLDDDDFDSDSDWDDSPEPIDYNRSFSTNIQLDAIPLEQILKNPHTQNLKWTQIMEKFQISIDHLTTKEWNLQDAKYELISSEWSFFKALNILYGQFVEKLFIALSKNEENKLFAYVKEVKDCSEKLLKNMETCWKNNLFMENFCDILCKNLENDFDVYVHYCAHQIYSEELLGEIVSDKSRIFHEFLNDIQTDPVCNGLHLHAYQLIPIRKINSFPNLLENIMKCLTPQDREYQLCKNALYITKQLLYRCNTESKEAKEHLRTKSILEKLEFPKNSQLKLNQGDVHMRRFIKSDKMDITEMSSTLFGKKVTKKTVYVFLFNDIFVVARKSNANKYMVMDYCFRINLELDTNPIYLNVTFGSIDLSTILYLHIKENRELKPAEMILSCKTKTDAVRWIEALDPPETAKSGEKFSFDFIRKVIVQRNYSAAHSDEINLTIGEIYTILRETEDGWSFGQRDKDGECGWFQTENVLLVDDVRQRVSGVKQKYKTSRQQH